MPEAARPRRLPGLAVATALRSAPPPGRPPRPDSFPEHERRSLQREPGIGRVMVLRLEAAGLAPLSHVRRLGATETIEALVRFTGQRRWHDRLPALHRVLQALAAE